MRECEALMRVAFDRIMIKRMRGKNRERKEKKKKKANKKYCEIRISCNINFLFNMIKLSWNS